LWVIEWALPGISDVSNMDQTNAQSLL
jgi:hypothetical protein